MCLSITLQKINTYIKSFIYGLEYNDIVKFSEYCDDINIYKIIKESDFVYDDLLIKYLIGDYKELVIDNINYLIIEKYFKHSKSKLIKDILKNDKNRFQINLNIKNKYIIDFIIQYLFFFDEFYVLLLQFNFTDKPYFYYRSEFLNINIYKINKRNHYECFLKLVNYFKLYDFYNLQKYIKSNK